jgi:hypothetical protein
MPALIDAAERDPLFAVLHHREALIRHQVVRTVITRGIQRGELAQDTEVDDVLDLVAGPLFHRRMISAGSVDTAFARRVVDVVLRAYGP